MADGHVERLIGSIRRECLDHVVVLGERQLRRLLANYAAHYNSVRTHLALGKGPSGFVIAVAARDPTSSTSG
jgi:hypothetical protein